MRLRIKITLLHTSFGKVSEIAERGGRTNLLPLKMEGTVNGVRLFSSWFITRIIASDQHGREGVDNNDDLDRQSCNII
jgi:hypothetical protein